jgi:hypothetical protein
MIVKERSSPVTAASPEQKNEILLDIRDLSFTTF